MKIENLKIQNVKNIRELEVTPHGNIVIIGGDNGAGKSSLLDGIDLALHGRGITCERPLRDGCKKGYVDLDLGKYQVLWTVTAKTTTLTVTADGQRLASPQSILNDLYGSLTFDPELFSRQKAAEQLLTLQELLGLDFTEHDARHKEVFDERTHVGRTIKDLRGRLQGMAHHDEVEGEEVDIADLHNELTEALEANSKRTAREESLTQLKQDIEKVNAEEANAREQARVWTEKAESLHNSGVGLATRIEALGHELGTEDFADPTPEIRERIAGVDEFNRQVRDNTAYRAAEDELSSQTQQHGSLCESIETLHEERESAIAAAEMPIEGLSLGVEGVLFNNLPFDQCSSAEKLRISVAMGLKMNPELKILLIRNGSLLDAGNLAMIADMAEAADAQLWIERVGKGKECQLIIEDGSVAAGD